MIVPLILQCKEMHVCIFQGTYINSRVKAHEANEENSESDDDEFSGRALVYDSDEEEEVSIQIYLLFSLFYLKSGYNPLPSLPTEEVILSS